jgi:hypothetical protein
MAHVGEHLYSRAGKQTNNNNNKKPLSNKSQVRMGHGSSDRVLAEQVSSLEFKLQYCK